MMQLVKYNAARKALSEAQKVDEVKDIRDKAEAMAAYARQARDIELIQWATEIKVRAERKCGEMLKQSAKNGERDNGKGNRNVALKSHDGISKPKLADLDITPNQSSRWQKLADIPDEHFETAVETAKEQAGQVTTAHMLRVADMLRENATMKADLKQAGIDGRKRDAADPFLQALHAWTPVESAIERVLKSIVKASAIEDVPPCPDDKANKILKQWATVSEFLSQHMRQS